VRGPEVDFVGVLSEAVGHPTAQQTVGERRGPAPNEAESPRPEQPYYRVPVHRLTMYRLPEYYDGHGRDNAAGARSPLDTTEMARLDSGGPHSDCRDRPLLPPRCRLYGCGGRMRRRVTDGDRLRSFGPKK
jgi:hypothetical protein